MIKLQYEQSSTFELEMHLSQVSSLFKKNTKILQ